MAKGFVRRAATALEGGSAVEADRSARPARPALFPCGCSRLKVEAGKCDLYGPDGAPRGFPRGMCDAKEGT